MSDAYLSLGYGQLALAAALVLVNVGLSIALRLGLARSLLIASARTIVQLLAIGYALEWLFAQRNPWAIAAIGLGMAAVASNAAVNRTRHRFPRIYLDSLISLTLSSMAVTGILLAIVRVRPWYDPQYAIPLLGMLLGNTLNGISLGLDRFLDALADRRDRIEMLLALGATRWEAARPEVRDALRSGMTPIINSMTIVGLVSLPGMMTGQILAGAAPIDAVRYQIVIMFAIAAGTALGTLGVVLLAFAALFDANHQLRSDRLQQR